MDIELTQERVRELLDYDYENGTLIRKFKSGKRKPCGHKAVCHGYGLVGIGGQTYLAHRVIWLLVHGTWPVGEIDHINRNKIDNRIENLREVSTAENQHNQIMRRNNTSGYPGVSFHKRDDKWQAYITVDNKLIHLGYFDTPEAAFEAYKRAKIKYHPSSPIAQQYKRNLELSYE